LQYAEAFVLANGYTSAPAAVDKTKIVWALGDNPAQVDEVLRSRHDTLKPHAYGLSAGVPGDPQAWTVVFEYTDRVVALTESIERKPREHPDGAVVRVKLGPDGPVAVTQHAPLFLSKVPRLPPSDEVRTACASLDKHQSTARP